MEKSYLVEVVERDCPICSTTHSIEKRRRLGSMLIKGEPVLFDEIYYYCPHCADDDENEFVSAEMMDENLQNARNSYRKKHGLLTSHEIIALRASYKLSQSDLALLLGWGEITITRYESKSIQDQTYDQILRMMKDDPAFALNQLSRQKAAFSVEKYSSIKSTILDRITQVGFARLTQMTIEAQYANFDEPSDFNGYQKLDLLKIQSVISFFAHYDNNLFKVKLMKLLWYVDALSFKKRGKAITGLVYEHKPYGALPIANSEIIHLPNLQIEEIEFEDKVGYRISAVNGGSLDGFESEEIDIIYQVAKRFHKVVTQQIVEYMHQEDAYKNTAMNQIIPFSLCQSLKEL